MRVAEIEVVGLSLDAQYAFDWKGAVRAEESLRESFPGVEIFKTDKELLKRFPLTRVDRGDAPVRRDPASRVPRRSSFKTFALFALLTLGAGLLLPLVFDLSRLGLENIDAEHRKLAVISVCMVFTSLSFWHTISINFI